MMNIFADSIFTATRIGPRDIPRLNPYIGERVVTRHNQNEQRKWTFFGSPQKTKG